MADIYTVIKQGINLYFSTIFIPAGIVCNLVSALVFLQPKLNNKTTVGFLHAFLCIFNIFSLTNSILFAQLFPLLNIDLQDVSYFTCTLLNVWEKVALQIPSMQQLLVTFKIFVDVCYPKQFLFMKSRKILSMMMVILGVFLFGANSIYFSFYMGIRSSFTSTSSSSSSSSNTTNSTSKSAKIECVNTSIISFMTDLINILLRDLIPFVLMTLLNIKVCYTLIISKRRIASNNNAQFKRTFSFTISVIAMNIIFFLLFLPWSVSFILNYIYKFSTSSNQLKLDAFNMFKSFATAIAFLNNFTVFITNFVTNRLFRQELVYLLHRLIQVITMGAVNLSSEPNRKASRSFSTKLTSAPTTKISPLTN